MFCEKAYINHQLTTPYTRQQNWVNESKNHTIMEMVRYVLREKGLPKIYLVHATKTTLF